MLCWIVITHFGLSLLLRCEADTTSVPIRQAVWTRLRITSLTIRQSHRALACHGIRASMLVSRFIACSRPPQLRVFAVVKQQRWATTANAGLPDGPARTRFAPSPTGYLHLGSLRTALFSYLLAKKTGGQFILRIEDTDAKRTVEDAESRLCRDLNWAGLQWDEGPDNGGPHGPYRQSERTALYQEHVQKLLENGHAYRCFCSAEKLESLARQRKELGLPTDYDRTCASMSKGQSDEKAAKGNEHVVRLMSPPHYPTFKDLVYGTIGKGNVQGKSDTAGVSLLKGQELYDDPVLLKSNGTPTYHLANVVDDHFMKITHVIRGTEWIPSTPKHLALYHAFGWEAPQFAHVGLLVDEQGRKLSKRDLVTDVNYWREKCGILPSAMINFVALLGWSHKRKSDTMDLQTMVDEFEMRFTKGNTTVTGEKLLFLQRAHAALAIEANSPNRDDMIRAVIACIKSRHEIDKAPNGTDLPTYLSNLLAVDGKRYESPEQYYQRTESFFTTPDLPPDPIDPSSLRIKLPGCILHLPITLLTNAAAKLAKVPANEWTADRLNLHCRSIVFALQTDALSMTRRSEESPAFKKKASKEFSALLFHYLRVALLAGGEGPGINMTMEVLGREVVRERLQRLQDAIAESRLWKEREDLRDAGVEEEDAGMEEKDAGTG